MHIVCGKRLFAYVITRCLTFWYFYLFQFQIIVNGDECAPVYKSWEKLGYEKSLNIDGAM